MKIRNLGPVRKAGIRFNKGVNIIYGSSGKGKTTIINAIQHLLKGEKRLYEPNGDKKTSEKTLIEIDLMNQKISSWRRSKRQYVQYKEKA